MQKICMQLSIALGSDYGFFMDLPLYELSETVKIYLEVMKDRKQRA